MFNPFLLTPTASINRVKIVIAPGLPRSLSGKTAYDLLGRNALIQQVVTQFPDLASLSDPMPEFDRRYHATHHPGAHSIAQDMGLRLAWLLYTLKQGAAENRAARPEWDVSYWEYWAGIERIIVGGGLVAGQLGQVMIQATRFALDGLVSIELAQHAAILPLLGAALKGADLGSEAALVFDFGGTAVKRARMQYHERKLQRYHSVPVPASREPAELLEAMVNLIVATWRSADRNGLSPNITASIANYVQNCQLAEDTSHGRLRSLGENSCDLIASEVGRRLDCPITLTLIHDGTAAAYVYAGSPKTAVIMVGTALGVGFPPLGGAPASLGSDQYTIEEIN